MREWQRRTRGWWHRHGHGGADGGVAVLDHAASVLEWGGAAVPSGRRLYLTAGRVRRPHERVSFPRAADVPVRR